MRESTIKERQVTKYLDILIKPSLAECLKPFNNMACHLSSVMLFRFTYQAIHTQVVNQHFMTHKSSRDESRSKLYIDGELVELRGHEALPGGGHQKQEESGVLGSHRLQCFLTTLTSLMSLI